LWEAEIAFARALVIPTQAILIRVKSNVRSRAIVQWPIICRRRTETIPSVAREWHP
jgi:hypothetical protein